jgi:hypothetical protein
MEDLNVFTEPKIVLGQAILADRMKIHVHNKNKALFNNLNFSDDSIFLEPLLFAHYFSEVFKKKQNISTEEILLGYLSDDKKSNFSLEILTDQKGIVYLPNIGYIVSNIKNNVLKVSIKNGGFDITSNDSMAEYVIEKPLKIKNTTIELCMGVPSILLEQFNNEENNLQQEKLDLSFLNTSTIAKKNKEKIEKAFFLLSKVLPEYHDQILKVARRIILFQSKTLVSFASRVAHGTIFLNVQEGDDEIFFFTELVHQFGHVLLYSIMADPKQYFLIDYRTALSKLNNNDKEKRSLYSAFHGLFTTTQVATALEILLEKEPLERKQKYEVLGRLVDNKRRFRTGLEKLNMPEILTSTGLTLYTLLDNHCQDVYKRKENLITQYNVSEQPFVFSFKKFLQQNSEIVL